MFSYDVHALSSLCYFNPVSYHFSQDHTCDFSVLPRPFSSMALMLDGEGFLESAFDKVPIQIHKGDLLFIPVGQRYISSWRGSPNISYLTVHFNFKQAGAGFSPSHFRMQKVSALDFNLLSDDFEYICQHRLSERKETLAVLSKFYAAYYSVLPQLVPAVMPVARSSTVQNAIEYIDAHYTSNFKVEALAERCYLSESRFFYIFKKETGLSPIEYKNHIRINRAIQLLEIDARKIEDIAAELGFSNTAHFRRIFKNVTGKNPKEYQQGLYHL
ncbi:MAG: AraC family transcriptional regulator [Paenibacillaceae bacterium]|jgi:AraC-like DNA-binding protein|nr:AraC family transcriptional regulator [Paenibacillaceae bacterium]